MEHPDFSDLAAVFVNCSLKDAPRASHTMRLMDRSIGIMRDLGVTVDVIHALEHEIAVGMEKDLTEHGRDRDDAQARMTALDPTKKPVFTR